MSKKISYIDLLKEAVAGYNENKYTDIPKNVDVKGPFVDGIQSYEGDGELVTYKDASSILERYYFDKDEGIESLRETHEEEAAGDETGEPIAKVKDDIEKKVTEGEEVEDEEGDEVEDLSEVEKGIVEKLIEEMEEEDDEEGEEVVDEAVKDVEPAGLAGKEKVLPEGEEVEDEEDEEGDEEEDLDIDKELDEWGTGLLEDDDKDDDEEDDEEGEEVVDEEDLEEKKKVKTESGPVGGPLGKNKSSGKNKGQDEDGSDLLEEQFSLFKKEILDENKKNKKIKRMKSKDVIV